MIVSKSTFNVAQCGLGLCLILFAFLAMSSIEGTTLLDLNKHDQSISEHAGYYSQTIIYASFVISNLIAPFFISFVGCRWSMFIGSIGYTLFMSQFLYLSNFTLYAFSAIEGLGSGLMWTSAGYYMALNSDETTQGRNSSLLWLLSTFSNILGGIYLLCVFGFSHSTEIGTDLRTILFSTFCAVALVGNVVFCLVRTNEKEIEMREKKRKSYFHEMYETFRLIPTKKMLLLMIPYSFTGLETSFYTTVFPNSLSFTNKFPMDSKMVVGMNNLAVGIGQITGCLGCMYMERYTKRFGRFSILILATILNLIAFVLIALDIPGDASYKRTDNTALIPPSPYLAVVAGFLFGIVDSSFNTQLYAITSSLYDDNCSQAMALFKFYHAILSTVSMFYASVLSLLIQMGILSLLLISSTIAFTIVEIRFKRNHASFPVEKMTEAAVFSVLSEEEKESKTF